MCKNPIHSKIHGLDFPFSMRISEIQNTLKDYIFQSPWPVLLKGNIFAETNVYSKCHSRSREVPISFSASSVAYSRRNCQKYVHTAVGLRKTWLLHKQIKNRATLPYKISVRKCYQGLFLLQICSLTIQIHRLKLKIYN